MQRSNIPGDKMWNSSIAVHSCASESTVQGHAVLPVSCAGCCPSVVGTGEPVLEGPLHHPAVALSACTVTSALMLFSCCLDGV